VATPWAFSLLILPLGMSVGFIWKALPFLLSKAGVPIEQIAQIGALLQLPPIFMFLWTPIVDVKLRRRTWLVIATSVTVLCMWVACSLLGASHLKMLTAFLLGGGVVVALVMASCGGLMVTMLSASEHSKASAWNQAGNFGGGVLGAAVVLWLIDRVSLPLVGLADCGRVADNSPRIIGGLL
jgi:MFS transporter, PAT family, beta-lactamase induction signal transducer AmpG